MTSSPNTVNWNQITKDFNEQRCIIFLGPGVSRIQVDEKTIQIDVALAIHISTILDSYQQEYDTNSKNKLPYMAQQFLNIPKVRRVDLEDITKDFYTQNAPNLPADYKVIADLPAPVIVNTCPDNYMVNALVEKGKDPLVLHYNYRLNQSSRRNLDSSNKIDFASLSPQRPIVFNLLGDIKTPESLVLTLEDQMEFIRNIVKGDPEIPPEFLSHFDHRKTFILLGFDLSNWQFRLLLDSLNLQEENTTILPISNDSSINSVTKIFYEKRFNFNFLEQNHSNFATELRNKIISDSKQKEHSIFIAYHENEEVYLNGLVKA